jgi:hypothetical protein
MKTKNSKSLAIALLALSPVSVMASGCGKSPLLNHDNAERRPVGGDTNNRQPGSPAPTAADCSLSFPSNGLCASLTWESGPSGDDENSFTLRFFDGSGAARDADAEVYAQLWMPAMGHGSSPVLVAAQGSGVYSVTRVFFIMPGTWDLRVQLKRNGQVVEQAVTQVTIR